MSQVVDRFLQYVSFDTQSEEGAAKQPSTDKQWELARLLKQELEELGAEQVRLSEYGYIYAEIPSNLPEDQAGKVPALGFISHMDTSTAVSGENAERTSATEARLSWNSQNDAMGYCIRLGIAPDKLYNSILLYGQNDYTVTFLNKETEKYYFAVDSFNESGITKGSINEF